MQHAGEAHETKRERIARPLRGVSRLLCALGALGVRVCLCVILCGRAVPWAVQCLFTCPSVYIPIRHQVLVFMTATPTNGATRTSAGRRRASTQRRLSRHRWTLIADAAGHHAQGWSSRRSCIGRQTCRNRCACRSRQGAAAGAVRFACRSHSDIKGCRVALLTEARLWQHRMGVC